MRGIRLRRALWWILFAALLGAGLGLGAATLFDAWVRLAAGEYNRHTLLRVLLLLVAGLACFWGAASARAQAMAPMVPKDWKEQVWIRGPSA